MTASRQKANQRLQSLTLALSVVLAVALAGIIYLSLTSLPYLALSPTTDPVFGKLNACMLAAVPERLGFAVSRDASRVTAWSPSAVAECAGLPPLSREFPFSGVTHGTYDGTGALWLASAAPDGGPSILRRFSDGAWTERGVLAPAILVGTAQGVVALEPSGELIALSASGEVTATRMLPVTARDIQLQTSGDGKWLALWGNGRFAVIDAVTLKSTPAEVPCPVINVWWRADALSLVIECVDLSLEVNALGAENKLAQPGKRIPSTLVGLGGPSFQSCDVLPCSVVTTVF